MLCLVAQKGAREHYVVARSLHQRGLLAGLVTDWYAFGASQSRKQKPFQGVSLSAGQRLISRFSVSAFQRFGRPGSAALAARAEGIPDELVHSFPLRSLLWKWRVRQLAKKGRLHEGYIRTDSAFATAVAQLELPPHEVFFGYSYGSLEMLEAEKQRGVVTILDQIDPGAAEFRLVAEEMKRHPEIAGPPLEFPAANCDRNRREWELADIIIVNSEWTREGIVAEGADPGKIEILPLAYEVDGEKQPQIKAESRKQRTGSGELKTKIKNRFQVSDFRVSALSPLRVLWLGQVNVRKGIHYLMEAARLLEREKVQFDVVGPIGILPTAVATAPRNMTFHGSVSRDRAAEWYRQADVFVLPTLSDGFALTQLEALAHGVPVISTPNCGRVVESGKTGFVVPPRDSPALAEAILRFIRNPDLAQRMAPACRETVIPYSIGNFGRRLITIILKQAKGA